MKSFTVVILVVLFASTCFANNTGDEYEFKRLLTRNGYSKYINLAQIKIEQEMYLNNTNLRIFQIVEMKRLSPRVRLDREVFLAWKKWKTSADNINYWNKKPIIKYSRGNYHKVLKRPDFTEDKMQYASFNKLTISPVVTLGWNLKNYPEFQRDGRVIYGFGDKYFISSLRESKTIPGYWEVNITIPKNTYIHFRLIRLFTSEKEFPVNLVFRFPYEIIKNHNGISDNLIKRDRNFGRNDLCQVLILKNDKVSLINFTTPRRIIR